MNYVKVRPILILILLILNSIPVLAKQIDKTSAQYIDQITKKQLHRANSYLKSHNTDKANQILLEVLTNANTIDKCLTIVEYTKDFGYPFIDIRRKCLEKALSLGQSEDEILQITKVARKFDFYEVTRDAITGLLAKENTPSQLYLLASKCQEFSLNDISQLCMNKAFGLISSVADGFIFANKAKALGMEDLTHKMLKALIDDENNTHQLCVLLNEVQSFELPDLNRYLLKRALDQSTTVPDYASVWEASRRLGQADLQDLAAYRGKKLQMLEKIKHDQEEYQNKINNINQQNNSTNDNSNF